MEGGGRVWGRVFFFSFENHKNKYVILIDENRYSVYKMKKLFLYQHKQRPIWPLTSEKNLTQISIHYVIHSSILYCRWHKTPLCNRCWFHLHYPFDFGDGISLTKNENGTSFFFFLSIFFWCWYYRNLYFLFLLFGSSFVWFITERITRITIFNSTEFPFPIFLPQMCVCVQSEAEAAVAAAAAHITKVRLC